MTLSAYRLLARPCEILAACWLVAGCQEATATRARRIVPHRLAGCPVEDSALVLSALGDFASPRTTSVDLKGGKETELPLDLVGVEASTSPAALRGVGYAAPPDDVHLTMWSAVGACDAFDDFPIPASQGGQAVTAFDGGAGVIVAGLDPLLVAGVNDSAFGLAWDTRTGEKGALKSLRRISWSTATPFGRGALVAGGYDRKFLPFRYYDSALVFREGAYVDPPIPIGDPRGAHGAVVLASGATLLVGGEDDRGVLDTLVSITPTDTPPYGVADIFMLGSLTRARKLPTVLRLSTDEILVAGGMDGSGRYVPTLEWFSKDGRRCERVADCTSEPTELASATDWAFIALPGGGVLAVGGLTRDTGAPNRDVFWMSNDGRFERLPALTPVQRGAKRLRLVAASDGAPWLWNGTAWFRFDPWQNAFGTPDEAPEEGPDDDMPSPVSVDPGLFVWLARTAPGDRSQPATLRGFRHGVRGPYTHDPDFVLADPRHLAPNLPPRMNGELWPDGDGLHLSEFAAAAIADTTYGDVVVSGETPAGALPALTLGGAVVGGETCPWPAAGTKFQVTRTGRTVAMAVEGGPARATAQCTVPEGRVTIGLRGVAASTVTVRSLMVSRR